MDRKRMVWDSAAIIILGLWLLVSPLVLRYGFVSNVVWNDLFVGTLVVVLGAFKAIAQPRNPAVSWIAALLGVWLAVAPLVLGYAAAPALLWNSLIVGILLVILGWRSATATSSA